MSSSAIISRIKPRKVMGAGVSTPAPSSTVRYEIHKYLRIQTDHRTRIVYADSTTTYPTGGRGWKLVLAINKKGDI